MAWKLKTSGCHVSGIGNLPLKMFVVLVMIYVMESRTSHDANKDGMAEALLTGISID